jgi:DNA repair protein RecN (Recombination protein N)
MLRLLRIRDFALIHSLEVEFHPGLNLLTGETGSGKSIVVDALGLLAGRRAFPDLVRSGAEGCVIEGTFTFSSNSPVRSLLENGGIEIEDDVLVVRREISTNGRGRIFLNNTLATLSLLKKLGDQLADIHGQQEQLSLLDPSAQLEWLDRFGGNSELVFPVKTCYQELAEISRQIDSLRMDEQERLRRVDILQFQINEIINAGLKPGEREELENERKVLANHEKIFALSSEAYGLLYEHESALLSQARRLERILQELSSFDSNWEAHRESVAEALFKLEDLAFALRTYQSHLDFSSDRLNEIEQRLSELDKLSKKYGNTIESIINYAESCNNQLEVLVSHAERLTALAQQLGEVEKNYLSLAVRLSEKRHLDARKIERETRKEFEALAMEMMRMEVHFHANDKDDPERENAARYGPDGLDHVEFRLAPNKGEEMRPLAKIASGGELSRIMLAIESLCGAGDREKTLVFDEVDTGIGGRVAEAVGKRLRALAQTHQVLCVTHLPQIAAFAQHHFNVAKQVQGARTETKITALTESGRVEELARMLGGQIITEITRRHALEMIDHSQKGLG